MRVTVDVDDLGARRPASVRRRVARWVGAAATRVRRRDDQRWRTLRLDRARSVASSLDLRGARVDEALELLDRYLDDASLAGLDQVTIIHGMGTGALRDAVRDGRGGPSARQVRRGRANAAKAATARRSSSSSARRRRGVSRRRRSGSARRSARWSAGSAHGHATGPGGEPRPASGRTGAETGAAIGQSAVGANGAPQVAPNGENCPKWKYAVRGALRAASDAGPAPGPGDPRWVVLLPGREAGFDARRSRGSPW